MTAHDETAAELIRVKTEQVARIDAIARGRPRWMAVQDLLDYFEAGHAPAASARSGIEKVPVLGPIARGLKGLGKDATTGSAEA